jgi:hypothetical protein
VFPELVATEPKLTSEVDRLWEAANADAASQSAVIESAIDYAQSHADVGIVEGTYRETIEDGVAWHHSDSTCYSRQAATAVAVVEQLRFMIIALI